MTKEMRFLALVIIIGLTVRYYTAASSTAKWAADTLIGIIHSFTHPGGSSAAKPAAPSSPVHNIPI